MEVILKKDIAKLGYRDEIVEVKAGFGRNYLIPQGLAVLATVSAKKMHSEILRQRSHKAEKLKEEAKVLATEIEGVSVSIGAKVGDNGKIFGSVNTIQLAEALKNKGLDVEHKAIAIDESIKTVGTYEAVVNLHKDVKATFKFEVVGE